MSRYDGLIIPRSYSEYINKTDAATLSQALQLSGVMDSAPTSGSNNPAKSGGIYNAIGNIENAANIDVTDINNAYEMGKLKIYWVSTTIQNIPNTNNAWYILSLANSTSISANAYITQIATPADNQNKNQMFIRHRYVESYSPFTMSWTEWKEL